MSFLRQTCRTSHRSISLVERHNSIILTPLSITSTRQQTRHFSENTRRRALNQRQHVYKTFQGQFPPDIHSQAQILSRARRRQFSSSNPRCHGHLDKPKPGEERHVTFIDKEGDSHVFEVADGDNLLDIAQANDLEMEGACGGSCACSTCHVIVSTEEMYEKMEEPTDDENDMLDLAFGLTETSRLGCQIKMSKELDGLVVNLPSMTRNLQASDFKSKEKD